MKKIKFRAWDKTNKKIYNWTSKMKKLFPECFGYYYVDNYCEKCSQKNKCIKEAKKEKNFMGQKEVLKLQKKGETDGNS